MTTLFAGFAAALLTLFFVPLIRRYALARGVVDDPKINPERRVHQKPIALLGGVAIWLSCLGVTIAAALLGFLPAGYVEWSHLLSLFVGSAVIMVGGYLDDRYHLKPYQSIFFPMLAAIIVVAGGVGVNFVTNPFGGVWRIDQWKIALFQSGGADYVFNIGADLFAFGWLMGMMYTTKLLDGLDGLVSGVTAIGAIILTLLSLAPPVLQPDTALLAAIVAGAFVGFLPYNWSPAKIFLGEGGSLFAGFSLGVLAIVAGGKIATTLLVFGLPALDVFVVILRRLWEGEGAQVADRKHLHFRLLDLLGVRQTVFLYYLVALSFGLVALGTNAWAKFIALAVLTAFMVLLGFLLVRVSRQ